MTDRPDIPEEAVEEALARFIAADIGLTDGIHDEDLVRDALQSAAPALRKQGAEEERERLRGAVRHFKSEADAADELSLQHPAGSESSVRLRAERDTYRYVLKRIAAALDQDDRGDAPVSSEPEEGNDA